MYSQQVGMYLRMCKLTIFSFILDLSSILKSKCNFLNIKIAVQRLVENTIFDEKGTKIALKPNGNQSHLCIKYYSSSSSQISDLNSKLVPRKEYYILQINHAEYLSLSVYYYQSISTYLVQALFSMILGLLKIQIFHLHITTQ